MLLREMICTPHFSCPKPLSRHRVTSCLHEATIVFSLRKSPDVKTVFKLVTRSHVALKTGTVDEERVTRPFYLCSAATLCVFMNWKWDRMSNDKEW